MKDWKKTLIRPTTPILEAIKIIDAGALQIALVTDDTIRLVGIVTDGDIRRALLKGISLDQPVNLIMNREFTTVDTHASREDTLALMKARDLRQIPVVDYKGVVVDLKILNDMIEIPNRDNWVVIMAGGFGTRLQPLTEECPKPLLKVGDRPLLETILRNFIEFGFRKFYFSVNYKGAMIEEFFGNGSTWGAEIQYIYEKQKLGTAGALGLLPENPTRSLIVMNGDVLTKVNFHHLLDFHEAHRAKATICVRDYHFQFPYGIIRKDQYRLTGIDEKPTQRFFVNAGIYVFEPEVLQFIPQNSHVDMPAIFERLIAEKYETVVFPIREYWMDIGRLEDFERANGEYRENFPQIIK
jgi:dTDP-glucose pyrophosphorylase/predicted transcriptional regulator